ncbi:hypothetical protein GGR53DRAFT_424829 [Hypoxylon sp. FL1150]|nr:hypothetical protein GGR53DRAFT_424829 [Hypoxylon sp. FL1150]
MSELSYSEEDNNREYIDESKLSTNIRSNEYTDSSSTGKPLGLQPGEEDYSEEDYSEDGSHSEESYYEKDHSYSFPEPFSTQHSEPTIPQRTRNPNSTPPPPICRPLQDGTFRNPFTSSKQEVIAMLDATNAANQRNPWIKWLQEDKHALRQSQIDSTKYREYRHNMSGRAVHSTQISSAPSTQKHSAPTVHIQMPAIGKYTTEDDPVRDGYISRGRHEGNYFQHGLQVDLPRGTIPPPGTWVDRSSAVKISLQSSSHHPHLTRLRNWSIYLHPIHSTAHGPSQNLRWKMECRLNYLPCRLLNTIMTFLARVRLPLQS